MKFMYEDEEVYVEFNCYANGRDAIRIRATDGGLIATLTCNLPEAALEEGEFFVKTWSENESIASVCLASGYFEDTGKRVASDYVEASVWRLSDAGKEVRHKEF